ncbi:glutaredoxin [Stackebrandtia endophytica]|uniref:Glutaredoxin n=1 Tax=Stackebrandtia endophytica TaxID=1496996 RepID=A0A543AYI4_9ACTN|nr:glutaredoxin family protein [Stackebrandtia endophytica]TQL77637.1 glutaredoxin [Stackebrandtia endophytica]
MDRLVLLTTNDCHLCVEARSAMRRVAQRSGVSWREVDVATDPKLAREYGDRLPVILLDGVEHGYWTVEEDRLLTDLADPPGPRRPW